jgi:hypothetical protein
MKRPGEFVDCRTGWATFRSSREDVGTFHTFASAELAPSRLKPVLRVYVQLRDSAAFGRARNDASNAKAQTYKSSRS